MVLTNITQDMELFNKNFFYQIWINLQEEPVDLFTFTKESLTGEIFRALFIVL